MLITALDDTILDGYEQWFGAVMAKDVDTLGGLLDETFVYTDIFGVVRYKAGYLALVERIPPGGITMRMEHLDVHCLATVALVTGRYRVGGGLDDGTDLSSHSRFTAVWQETDGAWRCLAHHATRLVAPAG
jgi:ketosteroid isomerase-like protein